MKSRWLIVVACGLIAAVSMGIYKGKGNRPMNDQDRIQGTWRLVAAERNGKVTPEESARHVLLVFEGSTLLTRNKDRETGASFRLNSATTPTEIDIDMDGEVGRGIYALDGDNLKIIHGEVGTNRPTEFAAPAGSELTLLVLQRVRP